MLQKSPQSLAVTGQNIGKTENSTVSKAVKRAQKSRGGNPE